MKSIWKKHSCVPVENLPPRSHPILSFLLSPRGNYKAVALSNAVCGKNIMVTGASYGIGRALAMKLGQAGARVFLLARSVHKLESVAEAITVAGGQARAWGVDLTDSAAIDELCEELAGENLAIDIVIHNAGKSIRRLATESLDRAHDFQRTMAVNYLGPVRLQLALMSAMLAQKSGHIINVSSLAVRLPPAPRWSAYTASKTAFDVWLRAVSPELRLHGIHCTSIYLGLVHTAMSAPTAAYRNMPGMTADEAAAVICRAIVNRPRSIAPWWLTPLRLLAPWCEGLIAWFWRRTLPYDTVEPPSPLQKEQP